MGRERLFLDTSFVVARFNRRDQHHTAANRLAARVDKCEVLWTTEAVLLECGAAFTDPARRSIAAMLWDQFHADPRLRLAPVSGSLIARGMELFRQRQDKLWSLADCVSFVLMAEERLSDALTSDHHFVQAGFRALLLEEEESKT
jgi:predicted nucleic acid-binding protein